MNWGTLFTAKSSTEHRSWNRMVNHHQQVQPGGCSYAKREGQVLWCHKIRACCGVCWHVIVAANLDVDAVLPMLLPAVSCLAAAC